MQIRSNARNLVYFLSVSLCLLNGGNAVAGSEGLPAAEYQARRQTIMEKLPSGILLLHAKAALFNVDQLLIYSFHQDPTFYYFTGLPNVVSAILAIDGRRKETWLFVPSKLNGMADALSTPFVQVGPATEKQLMIDHVVNWDQFIHYIDDQLKSDPSLALYTEDATPSIMTQPPVTSNPPGLAPVDDPLLLWRLALGQRWPRAKIRSASEHILQMQLVKSPAEIEVMRQVGKVSAAAVLAGMRAIRPGQSPRVVEADIVRACILSGGEGPSFWPLASSGYYSQIPQLLEAVADYYHKNRLMTAGDVVHLDLGCEVDLYDGDVGRTVPVSGFFTPGQRETWTLLVHAYQAGLAAIRDGVRREEVFSASLHAVRDMRRELNTELGRKAANKLLGKDGTADWYLHSSGLGDSTTSPTVLKAGMVVVFEPYIVLDGQGYYLEDNVLVTNDGYEVLTAGLPYSAEDIERVMVHNGD
jgi:Xaa-Pro aminopeptidase